MLGRGHWLAAGLALALVAGCATSSSDTTDATGDQGPGITDTPMDISDESGPEVKDLLLTATPISVNFAVVTPGAESFFTVTLTHSGFGGTLVISSVQLQGTTPAITVTEPEPSQLAPGESTTVTIRYAPTGPNGESGSLIVNHNGMPVGSITIPITAMAATVNLESNPTSVDFGLVNFELGAEKFVQVLNFGTVDVTIDSVSLDINGSPEFSLGGVTFPPGDSFPFVLGVNTLFGVTLHYLPVDDSSDTTTLSVSGSALGEARTWEFDVVGAGLAPRCVVTPGVIDFGTVTLGQKAPQVFTVSNVGNFDLVLRKNGIVTTPGSDAQIQVVDGPAEDLSVAPGSSLELHIEWTPSQIAEDTSLPIGGLSITSSDPTSPTILNITGIAKAQ